MRDVHNRGFCDIYKPCCGRRLRDYKTKEGQKNILLLLLILVIIAWVGRDLFSLDYTTFRLFS